MLTNRSILLLNLQNSYFRQRSLFLVQSIVKKILDPPFNVCSFLHTYIHNWPLQPPFSQDYGLASHTSHVECVNFIREWWDLQFNVDSERQIFKKLFMACLFTLRIFARNLLRGNCRRNIFRIAIFDD